MDYFREENLIFIRNKVYILYTWEFFKPYPEIEPKQENDCAIEYHGTPPFSHSKLTRHVNAHNNFGTGESLAYLLVRKHIWSREYQQLLPSACNRKKITIYMPHVQTASKIKHQTLNVAVFF